VFVARCYQVIDLGTQKTHYKGVLRDCAKVMIGWELVDPDAGTVKNGEMFTISKRYTGSLSERSLLCKDLIALRGCKFSDEELLDFDLSKVLGAYCQLQIIHTETEEGKLYTDVQTIMQRKGEKPAGQLENQLFSFDGARPARL
jgi:hypothetical protein